MHGAGERDDAGAYRSARKDPSEFNDAVEAYNDAVDALDMMNRRARTMLRPAAKRGPAQARQSGGACAYCAALPSSCITMSDLPRTAVIRIHDTLASDIAATPAQVRAAVELLDGGATVPFIARCLLYTSPSPRD